MSSSTLGRYGIVLFLDNVKSEILNVSLAREVKVAWLVTLNLQNIRMNILAADCRLQLGVEICRLRVKCIRQTRSTCKM